MGYIHLVPGQRAKGQKLVPIPMSEEFIADIDRASRAEGYDDRSKFIRQAVREKLESLGYDVPIERTMAPGRARQPAAAALQPTKQEKANLDSAAQRGISKAVKDAQKIGVVYGRLRKAGRTSGKTS